MNQNVTSLYEDKKIDTRLTKFGSIVGRGAKIGVGSTILPGVKIRSNVQVHPGSTVTRDIHDDHFFKEGNVERNRKSQK